MLRWTDTIASYSLVAAVTLGLVMPDNVLRRTVRRDVSSCELLPHGEVSTSAPRSSLSLD